MACGILVRFLAERCASGEHLRELYEFRGTITINLRVPSICKQGISLPALTPVRREKTATKTRVATIP
jgi:hypothetical protein